MTPEQWRQIEYLYNEARERIPADRAALLECTDPEIRQRVEQMLELDSGGHILDRPAPVLLDSFTEIVLSKGDRLGPYRIETPIGAGGMGTVYRAVDTRLGRAVAVKVVHRRFGNRFQLEAEAISALNHPNICTLYDVGPDYLVMELLEGQTLKERLATGPVSDQELCRIGVAVSDALVAAHAQGFVHRDIKPGNIFLTSRGTVKILDFGLAKTVSSSESDPLDRDSAVGTPAYMSPEQASGVEVDARTDLFSLGLVLHEMATGIGPDMGSELGQIITRALEKDLTLRYQTAAELHADLLRVQRQLDSGSSQERRRGSRYLPALLFASLLLIVAAGMRWFYSAQVPVTAPAEFVKLTQFPDSATAPSLSHNGRMVTFIRGGERFMTGGQIYVKQLPDGESIQLSDNPEPKYGPVFTPDDSRVAYMQWITSGGSLQWNTVTVPVSGGQPALFMTNAAGLSWIDAHHVLFSEVKTGIHMGVVTASENGADRREIYFPVHERGMAHYSYLSPDRKWILVVEMDGSGAFQQCRRTPFDGSSAGRLVGPEGTCTSAAWSPDGKWMYFGVYIGTNKHLWRQRFPDGQPEQITFGATEEDGVAVSPDGRSLVTSIGIRQSSVWIHDGAGMRSISPEGFAFDPRLSADGKRVYYLLRSDTGYFANELYRMDLASRTAERLLPEVSLRSYAISPDEKEAVFTKGPAGMESEIWVAALDGRSPARLITRAGDLPFWGRNGSIVFLSLGQKVNLIFQINKDGSGRRQLFQMPVYGLFGVSPDGTLVVASFARTNEDSAPNTFALDVNGAAPRRICKTYCDVAWSQDARFFYMTVEGLDERSRGKGTFALPIPPGRLLPDLPADGVADAKIPGAIMIDQPNIASGLNPNTYVFTESGVQRNLYRIPLH